MFNTNRLEELLITNWTEFLNLREVMAFLKNQVQSHLNSDDPISNLTISRFEWTSKGFIVWFEYKVRRQNQYFSYTTEALLTPTQLLPSKTEET